MGDKQTPFVPLTIGGRVIYGYVTFVAPLLCFFFANLSKPEWQSGKLSDYAHLMLSSTGSAIFYPFLLYSSISMLLLLIAPLRYCRFLIVRMGIYTGIVLSLSYSFIASIALLEVESLYSIRTLYIIVGFLSCLLPAGIKFLYLKLKERFGLKRTTNLIIVLIIVSWMLLSISFTGNGLFSNVLMMPFFAFFVSLALAPFWCSAIFILASIRLFQYIELHRPNRIRLYLGLMTWFAAYFTSLQIAVTKTVSEYLLLPTSPPNCYIATAAARGRLVKSSLVRAADGSLFHVNRQLQYLKCAELVLMAVWPSFHKLVRQIYDLIGLRLARLLILPLLSDATYFLLKPFEWTTRIFLTLFIPDLIRVAQRLYVNNEKRQR